MVEAVIFDLGGVLVHLHEARAKARFAQGLGHLAPQEQEARFRAALPLHEAYERGGMDTPSFFEAYQSHFGANWTWEWFSACWQEMFSPNTPVIDLLIDLSNRIPCHLLSNTNALHMAYLKQQFEFFCYFTTQVLSYEVGLLKPDASIYQLASAKAQTNPARCLFIDDRSENVEGAREAGLIAIQYTTPEELVIALEGHQIFWEFRHASSVL